MQIQRDTEGKAWIDVPSLKGYCRIIYDSKRDSFFMQWDDTRLRGGTPLVQWRVLENLREAAKAPALSVVPEAR
jgi:hypothetical protein